MAEKKRIEIIDALRGFALAGIVIVHIVEQYVGSALPEDALSAARLGWPDSAVDGIIEFFLRGKFFALFSLLFGLSFSIQFANAQERGDDYRLTYLWRVILLFFIGFAHHCIYRGDILTIYALIAPILILFVPLSSRWLWIFIGAILLGVPRVILFLTTQGVPFLGGEEMGPGSEAVVVYWELLQGGSFSEVAHANATQGFVNKMEFQLGMFYRFYLTFAYFLFGMWLGRIRFFEKLEDYKKQIKRALWLAPLSFLVAGVLTGVAFSFTGQGFSLQDPVTIVGLHMVDMANICLTLWILALFITAYRSDRFHYALNGLRYYGRMALTNYVLQSLIGAGLLFGWGFGFIGQLRNIELFGIGIIIILVQVFISKYWLSIFRQGPLEWLWRTCADLKFLKRKKKLI